MTRGRRLASDSRSLVVDPFVAFESDSIDDRILDHSNHQRIADLCDRHVAEETGRVKALQRSIDPLGIEFVALLHEQVGAHGIRLDALYALDDDLADHLPLLREGAARSELERQRQSQRKRREQPENERSQVAALRFFLNGSPRPSGSSVDSAAGEGDASEPTLDLGFAARKLGQISRSLICLTGHTRADPSTPDRCGDLFFSF